MNAIGVEFVLFVILGVTVFVPLSGTGKTVALVLYAVLMALWLLGFVTGLPLHLSR